MNPSTRMKAPVRKGLTMILLLGVLLLPLTLARAEPSQREQYIQAVITLLRIHADAIRQLATHDFKYSHNLARHATALHNTFGLLGPMDWHAAEAASLQKRQGPVHNLKPDDFDKMADQCQKSIKDLYQSSIQHMESGGGSEPVLKALDEVQGRCNDCHNLLDGAAPDVWGNQGDRGSVKK